MDSIKKYLNTSVFIAAVVYLITCAALYVVQYGPYDKAFETVFIYMVVPVPMYFCVILIHPHETAQKEMSVARRRIQSAIGWLLCIVLFIVLFALAHSLLLYLMFCGMLLRNYKTVAQTDISMTRKRIQSTISWFLFNALVLFVLFLLFRNENYKIDLSLWQTLVLLVVVDIILILQKLWHLNIDVTDVKANANIISIVYSSVLLATVLFLLITGPKSVNGAKESLRDAGYQNIEYIWHPKPAASYEDTNSTFGFYVFSGEKDDTEYWIYIDISDGEIVKENTIDFDAAYYATKAGGDTGHSLSYWVFVTLLAAVSGLGIRQWQKNRDEDADIQSELTYSAANNTWNCPSCLNEIDRNVSFCPHCGIDILEYNIKQQAIKAKELKEKYKYLDDLFNDAVIMEDARLMRRLYGKMAYIGYLRGKAKELGLGDITINPDDIE